jgi:hypothetical protein
MAATATAPPVKQQRQVEQRAPSSDGLPLDLGFLERIAVGKRDANGKLITDGKRLFLVSLQGHKSRVIDPDKGVPLYVVQLPIWAANEGDARYYFENVHHVGLVASSRVVIELAEGQ